MKSDALGVVVVRLQVPELHAGHRYLLNSVTAIHKRVLVLIGETEARLTPDDPLTYEMRAAMLKASYLNVIVDRVKDHPHDVAWSVNVDRIILKYALEGGQDLKPTLYGGRDSFLNHYFGVFRTFELPPIQPVSGTEVRQAVVPKNSADFREGMIYGAKFRFPTSYQCVDVAVMRPTTNGWDVLLGQKSIDGDKWRFIGGFVSPSDASLERAAAREVREETGIEPGDSRYLGSMQVEDHRYPSEGSDRLMTAFFVMTATFGSGVAGDDIDKCSWHDFYSLEDILIPQHLPLLKMLNERF